ncbi:MAG: formylglycine-generating enzyme family protein, partial [Gemmata sp.]
EAEARADAELAKAAEQKKRRRVQLDLAGVVAATLTGVWVAVVLLRDKQSHYKLLAEQKRQELQRQAKADALVQALESASTVEVPRLIEELKDYRDLSRARLRELAALPVSEKPGLHARLALMADDPAQVKAVGEYVTECHMNEVLTIRDALTPHAATVAPECWAVLTDTGASANRRVRAAGALAALTPADARWEGVVAAVADAVVRATPDEFVVCKAGLEPVRGVLVPALLAQYKDLQKHIVSDKKGNRVAELLGEVGRYDLTADLLAQYGKDRPAALAELAVVADPRHYKKFVPAIQAEKSAVVPLLTAKVAEVPSEKLAADKVHAAMEEWGQRRGYAAAALVWLGEGSRVWPVFAFPGDGDPTARSYLQQRLAQISANAGVMGTRETRETLVARYAAEADVSAKRALLITLGELPQDAVPGAAREAMAAQLLVQYREHPDPGLHSAIDWLLRQQWGKGKKLAAIDAELAAGMRGLVLAGGLADLAPGSLPLGPLRPAPGVSRGKDWFVNGEGQTYAVVRGPVEFTLGSPPSESGLVNADEPAHRKRIGRTFAIATKEVTMGEFRRFRPGHEEGNRHSPGEDAPAVGVSWYAAAEYCNWLSAREGIPREQWCYEPNKEGVYAEGMSMKAGHLGLTGYRLPTEAEWEFACRAGSVTSRHYGRGEGLLPRYGWFVKTVESQSRPVGGLRPNDLGLFDTLGNAFEWVEDPWLPDVAITREDNGNEMITRIDERVSHIIRGGSFLSLPMSLRSAFRSYLRPGDRVTAFGFRPARTVP